MRREDERGWIRQGTVREREGEGNQNKRIHIESGQNTIQNFTDIEHTNSEIVQYGQDIAQTSYDISQKNDMRQFEDIKAVLEEMAQQVSQTLYLLSLK